MNSSKKFTRGLIAAAACSFVAASLLGCSSSAGSDASAPPADCTPQTEGLTTVNAGVLTVGVPENLPYTKNEGSDADGFEIDLVRKLSEAECLGVKFEVITYGNGIPTITAQKKVDMITGGWYITPARQEQVAFTVPTFYDSMAIISADGIDTVKGLEKIGAVGSVAGFSWEADMSKVLGNELKTYPSTLETKQDLMAGRVQAALDGFAVAKAAYEGTDFQVEIAQADDRIAITTDQPMIGFPTSKDNPALTDALSELINQYREDGTLTQILADWDLPADLVVPADAAATVKN
ncbi:substrate-binding periplasmic protein [Leucobacter sp. HY1910]